MNNDAEAYFNLGNSLRTQGRRAEAGDCYRQALRLRPDFAEAHLNLGTMLFNHGRLEEAAEHFRHALAHRPDFLEARYNLGNLLREQGRLDEAMEHLRPLLRARPDLPDALIDLANALHNYGRLDDAAMCFRQILDLRPDLPGVHYNLGNVLFQQGRLDGASESFRRAVALRPDFAEAHNNLGGTLRDQGQLVAAEDCFRRALTLSPEYAEAFVNLGNVLQDQGRLDEATTSFGRALELRPNLTDAHHGLLMALHYAAGATPHEIAAAHAEFQRRHAAPLRLTWRPHANDRHAERPLRLAFVSADFGRHPAGFLLVRTVEALARRPGSLVFYSDRRAPPDDVTARLRAAATIWHDTASLSDERLAHLVRADAVDVLIDMAGHTGSNRLLMFARKPAPVQATWLGYEGTTGLEAIDYLIADDRLIPPRAEVNYRERILRLPGGYACYDPPANAPEPGPPPALANGTVTFGCFNNIAKLSPPTLTAFASVLSRVPGSRLILQYRGLGDPTIAARFRERLTAAGLDVARVELRRATGHAAYLAAYRDIDIALDTFPFNGGVTTCDALWMGVPVVTLMGQTFASRHGLTYLTAVGLADDLVARNSDEYAVRAASLARSPARVAALRADLRDRMATSPLCDGERLAAELVTVLRVAWREWAGGVSR
jgi:predicted O-linked N-acetylglucosamine transferase (SPINDLY family)